MVTKSKYLIAHGYMLLGFIQHFWWRIICLHEPCKDVICLNQNKVISCLCKLLFTLAFNSCTKVQQQVIEKYVADLSYMSEEALCGTQEAAMDWNFIGS